MNSCKNKGKQKKKKTSEKGCTCEKPPRKATRFERCLLDPRGTRNDSTRNDSKTSRRAFTADWSNRANSSSSPTEGVEDSESESSVQVPEDSAEHEPSVVLKLRIRSFAGSKELESHDSRPCGLRFFRR